MARRYSAPTLSQEGSTDQSARQPGAALKIEMEFRQHRREPPPVPSRPCHSHSQHATQAQNLTRPKSPRAMARLNVPKI